MTVIAEKPSEMQGFALYFSSVSSVRARGFSLIELSIVIVVIGLLVGTIASGQVLVRAAEMNSVVVDFEEIRTSTDAFRIKYMALPGDMPNATDVWGIRAGATGNDDTCYGSISTDKTTCNGDGDNQIDNGYSATFVNAERGRYWQHLANAGFVAGNYTGYQGPGVSEFRVGGLNAKASRVARTHYSAAYINTDAGGWIATNFYPFTGNIVELTRDFTTQPEPTRDILTASEALNIDTKIDDGRPALGRIRGAKKDMDYAANCTTSTSTSADYALSQSGQVCYVYLTLK